MIKLHDFDNIDELINAYHMNPDEDSKYAVIKACGRLSLALSQVSGYSTYNDKYGNSTELFVLLRNYALSYKGNDFVNDAINLINSKYL